MKPLVLYCRWQEARLRLRGRDETAVWGELVFGAGEKMVKRPFRYILATQELMLETENGRVILELDEMGVVIQERAA
ncbi:MAG: hypothetical protein D6706_05865 [Chloroflexi bacterium]|nr:MAG: hypothetical protein D6706_05865 [Chloroflexota bacterium]